MTTPRTPRPVTFGSNLATGEDVELSDHHRTRHVCVIGRTGQGKSTLLEHLILADLDSHTSAIVIDPEGDLSRRIISLVSDEQRERITLLEEWKKRPFRLNLLDCPDDDIDRTVDGVITLFQRLFNQPHYAAWLEMYLGNALRTLIPNVSNGATFANIVDLFWDKAYRDSLLPQVDNPMVRKWWSSYYDKLSERDRTEQLSSTINRLTNRFLMSPATHAMIDSTETTAPLDQVLNQDGQLLLIRIPVGEIGHQKSQFYGSLFLSLLADRIFARSAEQSERHRLHLYLDEYGRFMTPTTVTLLQQGRKYNLGATIAAQTLADFPDEQNKAAALQTGTHLFFKLTGKDADELVSMLQAIRRQETIEDDLGPKETLGPPQQPVTFLLEHRHRNPIAAAATDAFLVPITDELQAREEAARQQQYVRARVPAKLEAFTTPPEPYQKAIRLLDQLLVKTMEQRLDLTSHNLAIIAADILIYLNRLPPLFIKVNDDEFKAKLAQHIQSAAQATNPTGYLSSTRHSDDTFWQWLVAFAHKYYDDKLAKIPEFESPPETPLLKNIINFYEGYRDDIGLWKLAARLYPNELEDNLSRFSSHPLYYDSILNDPNKLKEICRQYGITPTEYRQRLIVCKQVRNERYTFVHQADALRKAYYEAKFASRDRHAYTQEKQQEEEMIYRYAERIDAHALHLILLCRVLATDPIQVKTGQYEPETRKHTILQSYADARTELASTLSNLRPHTAYYQTPEIPDPTPESSEEREVKLTAPNNDGYDDPKAIELVRKHSQTHYGRAIEDKPSDTTRPTTTPLRRPISRRSPQQPS